MDRLLASYRPNIKGKKWYWSLLLNALNISVVAPWRVHCKISTEKLSHLDFRRAITLCLLKSEKIPCPTSISASASLPGDVRFDGLNHLLASTTQGRRKICKKNTKSMCKKCHVRLHTERGKSCFEKYHKKDN